MGRNAIGICVSCVETETGVESEFAAVEGSVTSVVVAYGSPWTWSVSYGEALPVTSTANVTLNVASPWL